MDLDMEDPDPTEIAAEAFKGLGFDVQPKWICQQQNTKRFCMVHTLGTSFGGDAAHESRMEAMEATAIEILTFIEVCIVLYD
jgi:hypothetical protein